MISLNGGLIAENLRGGTFFGASSTADDRGG